MINKGARHFLRIASNFATLCNTCCLQVLTYLSNLCKTSFSHDLTLMSE